MLYGQSITYILNMLGGCSIDTILEYKGIDKDIYKQIDYDFTIHKPSNIYTTFKLLPKNKKFYIDSHIMYYLNKMINDTHFYYNYNIINYAKTLKDIMRQLSRWYDVTIVYTPDAPVNETFSAAVSRTRNISSVLERMQTTGSVKFKIEGKIITVTK